MRTAFSLPRGERVRILLPEPAPGSHDAAGYREAAVIGDGHRRVSFSTHDSVGIPRAPYRRSSSRSQIACWNGLLFGDSPTHCSS